ncbi:hypothetical protein [Paracoccus tibetensis]|uniref:Uncharacterized protein n=1 Tax=Paracoccus tibetensis TaxID=336292 RepID=A0A1G5HDD6_9RHOB|nr:hypothetical protein [Paracoccus tibetensis]SCY61776.1 hypothetical protein SAMN05660710_02118 [Paracoccus tibetensis]
MMGTYLQRLAVAADGGSEDRLALEAARLRDIMRRAMPAEGCGPGIPAAPARGPTRAVTPNVVMPDASTKSGYKVEATGWRGFKAARAIDIFDDLERRELARAQKEKREPALPFSREQVDIARRYRDLVEMHTAGGMKCASIETRTDGVGGGSGEFIDAYLWVGLQIKNLQQRIGSGAAMVVRRVRPSKRGKPTASVILDRQLVDAVCLHGKSFRDVLKAHGWSDDGKNTAALLAALTASLSRMANRGRKLP